MREGTSKAHTGGHGGAIPRQSGDAAALNAADWLSLAAAPAFAIMALLTAAHVGSPADILSPAAHDGSPLSGMTLMYVLMSIFHAAPWLKLISRQKKRFAVRRNEEACRRVPSLNLSIDASCRYRGAPRPGSRP
jgi:hypothetical protein